MWQSRSGATPVCSAGRCSAGCTAPEQLCSGSCVHLQRNTSHCGACVTPPATGRWILSVGAPFSLSTHTGDRRTVRTCYGQTRNGFFVMGSTTMIGVRSNNAAMCGPFTITATM